MYLGKILKETEITEEGFEEIVYKRRRTEKKRRVSKKVSRKHVKNKSKKIQNMEDNLDKNENGGEDTLSHNDNKDKTNRKRTEWIRPKRKPTDKEARQMFGKSLEIMLTVCLNNHLYQYQNKVIIKK